MSQHPIEGLMDVTLEKIKSMVDSIPSSIHQYGGRHTGAAHFKGDVRVRFPAARIFPARRRRTCSAAAAVRVFPSSPWLSWW